MSLRQKFLIPSMIVLLLGLSVLSGVGYLSSKSAVETAIGNQMSMASKGLATTADNWFNDRRMDVNGWASQSILSKAIDSSFLIKSTNKRLAQTKKDYGYYESLNLANLKGEVLASSEEALISKTLGNTDFLFRVTNGETVITDVRKSEITGRPVVLIAAPVMSKKKVNGVLFGAISIDYFAKQFASPLRIGETSRVIIFNAAGQAIIHPDDTQLFSLDAQTLTNGITDDSVLAEYTDEGVARLASVANSESLKWSVIVDASIEEISAPALKLGLITLGVSVIILIALAAAITILLETIVRPIAGLTSVMTVLADGNTAIEIPSLQRQDAVGEMAQAVFIFKENRIKSDTMAADEQKQQQVREERALRIENLTTDFDTSVSGALDTVFDAANELQATASSMSSTAVKTRTQSDDASNAADRAANNVQTVASAAEELSASISEISRQVAQSTQIAGEAVNEVETTNAKVQGLAQAAKKIGEVVALITDIADQTNLLALNATIEAARAGEAGKGFAVVASEVKNLATQTARATEEISAQIGGIQDATVEAVDAISSIGGTIGQINEIASAIAAAVEEQGAATQEIARNVEQAAQGTTDVTANISGVTQGASETGAASEQVTSASQQLTNQADSLRQNVVKFLSDVRAV